VPEHRLGAQHLSILLVAGEHFLAERTEFDGVRVHRSLNKKGCASPSLGTKRWWHRFNRHPGRTSSPPSPDLGLSVHTAFLKKRKPVFTGW
jgi:hypothetical protein